MLCHRLLFIKSKAVLTPRYTFKRNICLLPEGFRCDLRGIYTKSLSGFLLKNASDILYASRSLKCLHMITFCDIVQIAVKTTQLFQILCLIDPVKLILNLDKFPFIGNRIQILDII